MSPHVECCVIPGPLQHCEWAVGGEHVLCWIASSLRSRTPASPSCGRCPLFTQGSDCAFGVGAGVGWAFCPPRGWVSRLASGCERRGLLLQRSLPSDTAARRSRVDAEVITRSRPASRTGRAGETPLWSGLCVLEPFVTGAQPRSP